MSKSEWKVSSQYIGAEKVYLVYRLRNTSQVDHSGNREYSGPVFYSKDAAQACADKLNKEEQE